jgi:hypothetical protein
MLIGDDHEIAFACPSTFVVFKTGAAEPAIAGLIIPNSA